MNPSTLAVIVLSVVLGLAVGSFLNVVVWRVPRGESIVSPPSACPRCGHAIRARDNVPVLSWLLLRGKCRDCAEPISARYPLVEASTAVLFGLTAWFAGVAWILPALLFLAAISVALALIDIDTNRLPNQIVLPAYPVALALLALASWNPGGASDWGSFVHALIGGAAMYAVYFVLMIVRENAMGFGDVKLAGVLGLYLGWFGWSSLVVGWFAAFLIGGIYSIVLMVFKGVGRKAHIPYGPWMLLGAAVGIVWGQQVGDWYLSLM